MKLFSLTAVCIGFVIVMVYVKTLNDIPNYDAVFASCKELNEGETYNCVDDTVRRIARDVTPQKAVEVVEDLVSSDRSYYQYCHDLMHSVGHVAYEWYMEGKDLGINDRFEICTSGFYHGLLEYIISNRENVYEAGNFCDDIERYVPGNAVMSCYHGIGHGFVLMDERAYVDRPVEMMKAGVGACSFITNEHKRINCVSGVIDGTGSLFTIEYPMDPSFSLDLYRVCREIDASYTDVCHKSFNWLLIHMHEKPRIDTLLKSALSYSNNTYTVDSFQNLASLLPSNDLQNLHAYFKDCELITGRYRSACIVGSVEGPFERARSSGIINYIPLFTGICRDFAEQADRDTCFETLDTLSK